jgi:hypothetical protein
MSLNALYQFKGLGPLLDSSEAATKGWVLNALKTAIESKQDLAKIDSEPGDCQDFTNWQTGMVLMLPMGTGRSPLANTRQAQYILLRSRAYEQQVIHQTTHSLARFFLEVETSYKQYRQAQRALAAAAGRLDAQRSAYKDGHLAIDRLLEAIGQYAKTMAQETQHLSTYNVALASLSEAKGTLLADRNIIVATGPRRSQSWHAATAKLDDRATVTSFKLLPDEEQGLRPTGLKLSSLTTESRGKTPSFEPMTGAAGTAAAAKSWTFSITIGGSPSFQVKGTVTIEDQP